MRSRFEELRRSHWTTLEELILGTMRRVCDRDSLLFQMAEYHMRTGGKRLRAILPLMVAKAMDTDPQRLLAFGAACEALHNASIVHDDLQDGDTLRRGQPTVWSRFGSAQAINLGDALIACAFLILDHLEAAPTVREQVTRHMLLETLRAADGQSRDLDLKAKHSPQLEDHIKMIEAKTAAFFVLPIQGAAILCGADSTLEQALGQAAFHIGVSFQMRDDIADIMGAGAKAGHDLVNGNCNSLIVHCLAAANEDRKVWLRTLLERPSGERSLDDIQLAKNLIESTGSVIFARDEIRKRQTAAAAIPVLQRFPKSAELIKEIGEFCLGESS
jgi:geranylgeranyl pyrophosphate synthase